MLTNQRQVGWVMFLPVALVVSEACTKLLEEGFNAKTLFIPLKHTRLEKTVKGALKAEVPLRCCCPYVSALPMVFLPLLSPDDTGSRNYRYCKQDRLA